MKVKLLWLMMHGSDCQEKNILTSKVKNEFSEENYYLAVLEQYKLYAQILDEHHKRFTGTVKFFISIQLIFLSGFLFILKDEIQVGIFGIIMLLISALVICVTWLMISNTHYKYTTAKHETLEEMEFYLPLKPFSYEWHGKLKSGKKYISIRTLLFILPLIMSLIYISLGILVIFKL